MTRLCHHANKHIIIKITLGCIVYFSKGNDYMRKLFRILIIITACVVFYLITTNSNSTKEPLTGPNSTSKAIPKTDNVTEGFEDALPRPKEGLSTYIGKKSEAIKKEFGKPNRVDQTIYGYEWWVYNNNKDILMIGVDDNGLVSQVYTNGSSQNISPYHIGDSLDAIYRKTIMENEITATIDDNVYTFIMTEEDMKSRILTKFDQIYAQIYVNEEDETLNGIRFMDTETLVKHRPYEMTFVGKLITVPSIDSYIINESNIGSSNQLTDLTNSFRLQQDLQPLQSNVALNLIARDYSENLYVANQKGEDVEEDSFKTLLQRKDVKYDKHGEILANSYFDAIEAMHGFLNSNKHRKVIFNDDYTDIGAGVFLTYYTQVFIKKSDDAN